MKNRVFFPQAQLDEWGVDGKIELSESSLVLLAEGRRYSITEVVHVVAEVTGAEDPHGLVGKVREKSELEALGAEILETSMILGDHAYDVAPGWAALPSTTFAEHLLSPERMTARGDRTDVGAVPATEEDMLERFARGVS